MKKRISTGSLGRGDGYDMKVVTYPADNAVDKVADLTKTLSKSSHEWINVSSAQPIMIEGKLHYTFTITMGNLV